MRVRGNTHSTELQRGPVLVPPWGVSSCWKGELMDTGMVRKIDDLGRVVVPAETRRLFDIHEGDQLAISVEGDTIILRKMETRINVGEFSFEVSRDDYATWRAQITREIGSDEPEAVESELKRRLGF